MRIELSEVVWLDEQRELTLAELAELSGLSEAELHELEDCGAIAPIDPDAGTKTFSAPTICGPTALSSNRAGSMN